MRPWSLVAVVALVALLELPGTCSAPTCGCSCNKKEVKAKPLPARNCNEGDVCYYKRIFAVQGSCESTVNKFYENVFYKYEGESEEAYVKRIDVIFTQVYPNYDIRVNVAKKQFLKTYYECKYGKSKGENDERFFERVLVKRDENACSYKSKVELMKTFVQHVDWSKIKIEESTQRGFSIIQKAANVAKSGGCQGAKKLETKKSSCGCQKKEIQKPPCGCGAKKAEAQKNAQNGNQAKKLETKKSGCGCQSQKKEIQKPSCGCGAKKAEAQKNAQIENQKKAQAQKEQQAANQQKAQAQKEQQAANRQKAEEQNKQHCANEQRAEEQNKQHCANEQRAEEQNKQHIENQKKAEVQNGQHNSNVQKVEDQQANREKNVEIYDAKKKEHEENVRIWVKANLCKKNGEDIDTYYGRVCKNTETSEEAYVEKMTIARSTFSDLELWYSEKYLSYVQKYYETYYGKKTTETDEEYFKRLVTKETYESETNACKRINVLHSLFPTLSLWYDEQYYEKYTKSFYLSFYKQEESESSEVYLKRVFSKVSGESEECFWKRVKLVQKTFPDYKCWYEKENLQKLDACKEVSGVKSEEELKKKVESEKKGEETAECNKAKLGCLQTFFRSSKSSSSSTSSQSQSSEEQEVRCNN